MGLQKKMDSFEKFQRQNKKLPVQVDDNENDDAASASNYRDVEDAEVAVQREANHLSREGGNLDVNKLFETLMIENRRRDEFFEKILDRLGNRSENSDVGLEIMPELHKNILNFNGDTRQAKTWLNNLNSAQTLHNLPDTFMLETARTRLTEGASYWYDFKNKNK